MEQKPRKFVSRKRYVASVIIGTIVFLLIFGLSYSLSYLELNRVTGLQAETSYDIFEDRLDYSFFNEPFCSGAAFDQITKDLAFQGRIIDDLENKLGKNDVAVLERKKFYTLVELEHLEFINLLNERCDGNVDTILFFYSNSDPKLDTSEEAGRILGVLHQRRVNLVIYSFDIDLKSELVDKLEAKYNITTSEAPVIVINEETKLEMPVNIQEVEKRLSAFS